MKETLKNLSKAFVGESMARNRYTFYAKVAKKEGYEQIAEIFRLTAEQEKEHASWLFKLINQIKENDEDITVDGPVPNVYATTAENLQAAIDGENYEYTEMYPDFSEVAKKEGFADIAERLRNIAIAESHHEERFKKLLEQVKAGTVFKKSKEVWWTCKECGYVHFGEEPPKLCPSCDHEQAYYEVKCEEY
jgi:rubrerythrin